MTQQYSNTSVQKVAELLEQVAAQCRSDNEMPTDSKVQAVLETVADGALGLRTALKRYLARENGNVIGEEKLQTRPGLSGHMI